MLPTNVAQLIATQQLFRPTDQLLVAVSGGMDSMVLLHVLQTLGYRIGIAHCNFHLRGAESVADAAFVRAYAAAHELPYYEADFATTEIAAERGISTQMAARDLRYAFFEQTRREQGYDFILTAHHLDDRLETFWLNFTRGTGLQGLVALRAKTGHLRRPLLAVNRAEIALYQQAHELAYREDSSNDSDKYRRNEFRHHVLAPLYAWEPELAARAVDNFARLEQMYAVYQAGVQHFRATLLRETPDGWTCDLAGLKQTPAPETLLWEWLRPLGFSAEDGRQALHAKAGTILTAPDWELLVQTEALLLQKKRLEFTHFPLVWPAAQAVLPLPGGRFLRQAPAAIPNPIPTNSSEAWLDPANLAFPLRVRPWEPGDTFCPLGMAGKSQKLQDFFVNHKIDRLARARQLLLVNGDDRIIWVIGLRLDDRFKLTLGVGEALRIFYVSDTSKVSDT